MGPGSCRLQLHRLPCGLGQEAVRSSACLAAPCGVPPGSLTKQVQTIVDMLRLARNGSTQIKARLIVPNMFDKSIPSDIPFWDFRTAIQGTLEFATNFVLVKNCETVAHKRTVGSFTLDLAPSATALSYDLIVMSLDSVSKYTWIQKPEIQPCGRIPQRLHHLSRWGKNSPAGANANWRA